MFWKATPTGSEMAKTEEFSKEIGQGNLQQQEQTT